MAIATASLFVVASALHVFAVSDTSSSTNYQASQLQFGSGDANETCTGNYCASTSVGGSLSGDSASGTYAVKFGAITKSEPSLDVIVESGQHDLGEFSSSATSYKQMTLKVRNYLSSGYMVQFIGTPPKHSGHTLTALTTPTASQVGVEQFGINVVANTAPMVGANPVQVPSNAFSFGKAAADYDTPNLFKYMSGDVIALSDTASGETEYTISMIINVAGNTPAGKYTSDFSAVVIPLY